MVQLTHVVTSLPCTHTPVNLCEDSFTLIAQYAHMQRAKCSTQETMHCLHSWAECASSAVLLKTFSTGGDNWPIFALLVEPEAPPSGNILPLLTKLVG
jgi:hypothetical protein